MASDYSVILGERDRQSAACMCDSSDGMARSCNDNFVEDVNDLRSR